MVNAKRRRACRRLIFIAKNAVNGPADLTTDRVAKYRRKLFARQLGTKNVGCNMLYTGDWRRTRRVYGQPLCNYAPKGPEFGDDRLQRRLVGYGVAIAA